MTALDENGSNLRIDVGVDRMARDVFAETADEDEIDLSQFWIEQISRVDVARRRKEETAYLGRDQ